MTKLSIVIPVFNEVTLVSELIRRVKINCEIITHDFEVIIVDDGSLDPTWNEIVNEAEFDKRLKGIRFTRNFGHHYAITAGIHKSNGTWVVVMDGDLQDRPEVIPNLYKKAMDGFDVVFVSRQNRPEKIYYKIAQKLFYWILRILSGIDFNSKQANFSIINKKVVEEFKSFPENARFYGSTIKWLGFKSTSIHADHGKRFSGRPSYTIAKRIKLAGDIILAFTERPLKFSIGLGITISVGSIFFAIYSYINSLSLENSNSISNQSTILASIYLLSGITLTILGILGAYVGRIFQEVKRRPLYVVSETCNIE